MPQAIVQPEEPLGPHLIESIKRSCECRLAVAYLKSRALNTFCEAAMPLLRSGQLRLRVVFQSADLVTEPDAVAELLNLASKAPHDSVDVRWSVDKRLHAKAYGFLLQNSQRPIVFIGSANASSKALGANSGELSVRISGSAASGTAWESIGRMVSASRPVDEDWLAQYRVVYERHSRILRRARLVRATWMPKQTATGVRERSVSRRAWATKFAVLSVVSRGREEESKLSAAIDARGPE